MLRGFFCLGHLQGTKFPYNQEWRGYGGCVRAPASLLMAFLLLCTGVSAAFASFPLVTDDTGTQGKGKSQLEFDGQRDSSNSDGVKQTNTEVTPLLSYGLADRVDLVIGAPYQFIRTRQSGETTKGRGFSDVSLDVKWRFYEKEWLSFAVKPGITLPAGNDDKGLGTGKVTYALVFITTADLKPWAFHVNFGYSRNENTQNARTDIWDASLASEYQLMRNLKVVGNIGIERGDNRASSSNPAFLLGGLVYSLTEDVDVDGGYKYGLTRSEADHTILVGIAFRF
jgi:hypothetical protein